MMPSTGFEDIRIQIQETMRRFAVIQEVLPSVIETHTSREQKLSISLDSETVYLRIDHNIAPLNDVRVRKALNLAIDRKAFLLALNDMQYQRVEIELGAIS